MEVRDSDGDFVAIGTFYGPSHAAVRVLTTEPLKLDEAFFSQVFARCQSRRKGLENQDAVREVFSEADALPGLIVDRYGKHGVVQVRTLGMERLKPVWLPALVQAYGLESVYERSDYAGRKSEGMEPFSGQVHGETPDEVVVAENGVSHVVDLKTGLKTGHFLDQRRTRAELGRLVLPGETVLDLFCFTGGFSLVAAKAGAKVLGVDLSTEAIEQANKNAAHNGLEIEFKVGNAFEHLESDPKTYDWIVLDPPAIAKHKGEKKALRQAVYKLVKLAAPRLNQGGTMLVCSCSHQVSIEEMLQASQDGAEDSGTKLALSQITLQDLDHPVPLHFPEALYLKCLWLTMVG